MVMRYSYEDLDQPRYRLGQVAKAAGISTETLRNWINPARGVIKMGEHDRDAEGRGRHRLFTLRRALQVAITARLVAARHQPAEAAFLALGFTDVGDGTGGFGGGPAPLPERLPGMLYPEGWTLLLAYPGHEMSIIRNIDMETGAWWLFHHVGFHIDTVTAVHLNKVVDRVLSALALTDAGGEDDE